MYLLNQSTKQLLVSHWRLLLLSFVCLLIVLWMISKQRAAVAGLVTSATLLVSIAMHEGYVGSTYLDVVGIPTIGFGETKGVKPGQVTTPQRALVQLLSSVDEHAKGMAACIKVPLYQHEYDAYISFTYNVGVNAFCRSTLVRKLNEEKYSEACAELKRWNMAGGRIIQGLVTRREQEYRVCMGY